MSGLITDFEICEQKMDTFRPMADPCGVGNLADHWPNNVISTQTVIYGDGKFGFYQKAHAHEVEEEELDLCKTLASEAAVAASAVEFYSETDCGLLPFFIAKNFSEEKVEQITPDFIRDKFAGTIFPGTKIWCEPFRVGEDWWQLIDEDADGENEEYVSRWKDLVIWFGEHPQLEQATFVRIGDDTTMYRIPQSDYPPGTDMTGSCFPRLVLALTPKGSLVGLVGHAVLT